jgi:DNA-binding transcriptional ArsR family regulator
MTDPEKLARIFKVLSVHTRVRMVELLRDRSLCVNSLARTLDITPAAVSQHLRILRDADIVTAQKRGYFVHYRINEATLTEWNQMTKGLLEPKEGQPSPSRVAANSVDTAT